MKNDIPIIAAAVFFTLLIAIGLYELGHINGYIEASEDGELPIPGVVSDEK